MRESINSGWIKVWDPVVRIGHWILVLAFLTAYLSGDEWLAGHVWAGYTVAAVVLFRLLWGLIGSHHARFADFLYRPRAIFAHARELATGRVERHAGHNPLAGAMVMLLLISLLGTVGSGLMLYALEENAGPLAGLVETQAEGKSGRQERRARQHGEEHEDDDAEERWEEIHELFVNLTLVLVALHLLGVLVSSLAERQNLVRSMVTGWKRTGPSSG